MRPWCQQAQGWWKHSDTGRQDVGSEGVCLDVTKGKHNLGHWENWGNLGLANGFPQDPATDHDIYESLWLRNQGAKVLRNHLSKLLRVQVGQQRIFASKILFGWIIVGICWYDISGLVLSVTIKIQGWYYAFLILHMWKHSWHTENDMRERMIEAFCLPIPVGLWLPLPPSQGFQWFWNGQGFMIWDEICRIW